MTPSLKVPSVKFLDCTIRDGGYYNDWDFSIVEVQNYIDNLVRGGVDVIEIGFRFRPGTTFLGPFAYTSEQTLSKLALPENVEFGVMINASDYLTDTWHKDIEDNFVPARDSAVGLVRIAAHIGQVRKCAPMVAWLKEAGYKCGFNIMQISQADDDEITSLIAFIEAEYGDLDVLYFADSLGNLRAPDVKRIVGLFRAGSDKPIGFHGHDNIGQGVANSLAAIEAGATWVDATVTGMGRGAGNTQTEYLALELARRNLHDFNMLDIQKAATGWLADLKRECQWGTNIFYYEAGLRSLHPTYVQQMLSAKQYEPIDILVMIEALSNLETPTSYNGANIDRALARLMSHPEGADTLNLDWSGRPVLLLASGPNARRHSTAIMAHAAKVNAVCLAVNHLDYLDPALLDGVVCIHPARTMQVLEDTSWNAIPLFTSRASQPKNVQSQLRKRENVTDYGVEVDETAGFRVEPRGCTIPAPQVLAYAWAIAGARGASEILLAGFDGYDGVSRSFQQSAHVINVVREAAGLPTTTLTKTNFDIPARSIYFT